MIGMLVKEYYVMRGMAKSYLLMIGLFCILGIAGIYDLNFVGSICGMLVLLIPISAFAFDEQAGWDAYAVSTPAGRVGVVRGKYLFTMTTLLCAGAFNGVFYALAGLVRSGSVIKVEALGGVMVLLIGSFAVEVLLPILFKFGSQKSRVVLMLVMGVFMGNAIKFTPIIEKTQHHSPTFPISTRKRAYRPGGVYSA